MLHFGYLLIFFSLSASLLCNCAVVERESLTKEIEEEQFLIEGEQEERLFVVTAPQGSLLGLNLSQILPIIKLASITTLPLCILTTIAIVFFSHSKHSSGGYSSYSRRSSEKNSLDWEQISIIDWISVGVETYRNFEPSKIECHERFICEVHQNVHNFGDLANNFVYAFSFLHFTDLLSLPEELRALIHELLEAADRGRYLTKDCVQQFPDCHFSLKKVYNRLFKPDRGKEKMQSSFQINKKTKTSSYQKG